jgi:ABC-type transporter Mla subunit MlaD
MRRERNSLIAGLFVIMGLVLGFVVIVVLSDLGSWFVPMQKVHVRYALSDGLKGLKQGAEVTVGSDPAGSVTSIDDITNEQDVVVAKRVTFTIPARYRLFDNAVIELVQPPLGSGTSLNIESFGRDLGDQAGHLGPGWAYQPDETIPGGIAGSDLTASFARDLGIEQLQRRQIQSIIANVDRITGDVKTVTSALSANPEQLPVILGNVEQLTEKLKADVPAITGDLKNIMADLAQRRQQWFDQVTSVLDRADKALTTVNSILVENSDDLRNTIASARRTVGNFEQVSRTANEQTMGKVNQTLDDARAAVGDLKQAISTANKLVSTQRPVLEQTLANLRLTSDQLKLAAIEIRRSPWRLLYNPSAQELETNNLYDAARSFALAAGSLDSTAESLEVLVKNHGQQLNEDDPDLKLMLDNLHQTFEKFILAERRFWEAVEQGPASNDE